MTSKMTSRFKIPYSLYKVIRFRCEILGMRVLFTVLFILTSIWRSDEIIAQYPQFTSVGYTSENSDLSHDTILNIFQDSRGFLWIGTMDGLNRFDGRDFEIYRHNPADSSTLSDSFIHGVFERSDGMIWIGTRDGGFNILNPYTESIQRLEYQANEGNGIPNKPANLMFEDSKGFFWIGFFTSSMGTYDDELQKFIPINLQLKVTEDPVTSINHVLEFNDGSFLFSSLEGIYYINPGNIEQFRLNPAAHQPVNVVRIPFNRENQAPETNALYVDQEGRLWAELVGSTFEEVNSDFFSSELEMSINSGVVSSSSPNVIIEHQDYLLRGAGGGYLEFIHKETKLRQGILVSDEELNGTARLYVDNNDNHWFATWGGGFYLLKEKKGISLYTSEDGLQSEFMLAFADEIDGTWIGTNEGLAFLDSTGIITPHNKKIPDLGSQSIWSLWRDDLGLWITTRFDGVYFISDESIRSGSLATMNFTTENSLILQNDVHQIMRDSRGWLWIGYQGNGVQIIKNVEAWLNGVPANTIIISDTTPEESINSRSIRKLYEDDDGNMWVATTDNGFNYLVFDGSEIQKVETFEYQPNKEFSLSHRDARNIYQQDDSTFWFASYGGGITRWRSDSNTLLNLRTNNGLANNSTYGILPDKNRQFLWVSTNNGLSRLNTGTLKFENFTTADGLQNNEFNTGAYHLKEDGRLIFGGVAGFNVIDTDLITSESTEPPVFITSINLFNEVLDMDSSALFKGEISLSYNENFLSFEFAALDFHQPEEIQYAYMMEGVDEDFVYSGNRSFADYPNLKPGEYTFWVRAANSDGYWNETGTSTRIVINPPWWATAWFRTISGLLFLFGLVSVIRYYAQRRLKEQIRKMEVEQKLRDERERISRDLHDHVGAQLANIMSGLSLVDKYNDFDEKEKSAELMTSLKGDAEITIKQLRDTIWALNQNELNLAEFCDHLRAYFKTQSALQSSLDINIKSNQQGTVLLSSAQALNLFRIIQEASQNTLKYAGASELNILLIQVDGTLQVKIKDDGLFKENGVSFNGGYGMKNMRKRAEEIYGDIEIKTDNGTEVIVKIPV